MRNIDGWYKGPVTVKFTAFDMTSGLATFGPETVYLSTDGAAVSTTSTATDMAGNSNSATVTVKIDQVVPHTDVSLSGTEGTNGWYTTDVTMTLAGSDSLSGVKNTKYSTDDGNTWNDFTTPVTFGEGETTVLYRSTDFADNVEEAHSITIKVDKTAPASDVSLTGTMGNNGWYTSDVTMT